MFSNRRESRRFQFTKREIDNLPPHDPNSPSTEQEWSDIECRGLRLSVTKQGRKFFCHRYTINQRKRTIRLGEFPAVSLQEARQMVNKNKNLVANGIDPAVEVERQKTALTFQEFADTQYLPHAKENKKSWHCDYRIIHNDMIPVFGRYALTAITKRDVQRYLDGITARATGPTSNRHRSLIMRMFHLAIEWDFLTDNPCQGIRKHRENPAREIFLNPEEIGRLLNALDTIPQRVSACAIKFLIATGKRLKESMMLTWELIDMKEKIAYLHQDSTKGRKAERVILNALAIDTLQELQTYRIEGNPHVFPGNGPDGRLVTPCKVYLTAKKKAGLNKSIRLHDLRHSFASNMLSCGASLYEVQKLLGHKDAAMTQRYAHLADNTLRERTESMSKMIIQSIE